jgi:hypothetical protein
MKKGNKLKDVPVPHGYEKIARIRKPQDQFGKPSNKITLK